MRQCYKNSLSNTNLAELQNFKHQKHRMFIFYKNTTMEEQDVVEEKISKLFFPFLSQTIF